jgi:hypothetical protein
MAALHPGEMLREEFMKPLGLSSNALAMELRVPVTRISEIVRERSFGCACRWILIWSRHRMRRRQRFTRQFDLARRTRFLRINEWLLDRIAVKECGFSALIRMEKKN